MLEHGPFAVMAGAPWNVLDSRGCRIARCGGDSPAEWEKDGPPIAAAVVEALNQSATLTARVKRLEEIVARLPHTADGVPVIFDGMTLFCPKGHEHKMTHARNRLYCCTGECWSDGCQGDSGSGTGYPFEKCFAARASLAGEGE